MSRNTIIAMQIGIRTKDVGLIKIEYAVIKAIKIDHNIAFLPFIRNIKHPEKKMYNELRIESGDKYVLKNTVELFAKKTPNAKPKNNMNFLFIFLKTEKFKNKILVKDIKAFA